MRIGLYFGSFNPVHQGHLIIASAVADSGKVDQVWFVVSPQNPFKKSSTLLNEYHRLHLVNLAIEQDRRLKASDIEFNMPRPSYTIDTLTYLIEKYPSNQFSIIMGSDSLQNIKNWKNSEVLLRDFRFLIYERPKFPIQQSTENIEVISAPMLEISSTYIRNAINDKKSIRYLMPDTVVKEIEENHYYRK